MQIKKWHTVTDEDGNFDPTACITNTYTNAARQAVEQFGRCLVDNSTLTLSFSATVKVIQDDVPNKPRYFKAQVEYKKGKWIRTTINPENPTQKNKKRNKVTCSTKTKKK